VLAWGPLGLEPGITELPEGWARRVAHRRSAQPAHGPEVASDTMGLGDGSRFGELGPLQAGTSFDEEHVVLMARNEVLSRLPDVPGFLSSGPTAQRGDVPLAVGPDTPPQ
jgi:hypothetical protein